MCALIFIIYGDILSDIDISNHPIMKEDGLLAAFLTVPSFEEWRKHSAISLDEESASKRVDKAEEMSIPSDLEEKMAYATLILSSII
jgi:sorting nexin-8